MKKISYFMSMAVALMMGFTSCSSDDNLDGGITTPNSGERAFARVILNQAGPSTYAGDDLGDDGLEAPSKPNERPGLDSESNIKNARLYIFDGQQTFEKSEVLNLTEGVSDPFEISSGDHYFYVVANVAAKKLDWTKVKINVGDAMAKVEKELLGVASSAEFKSLVKENDFFMTSISEPVAYNIKVTPDDGVIPAENKIKLQVGRAVAKVNVEYTATEATSRQGTLSELKYYLANNPVQMHLFPVYDDAGHLSTPFYGLTASGPVAALADNYFNQGKFAYYSYDTESNSYVLQGEDTDLLELKGDPSSVGYAMENSNYTPQQDNATHIAVRGKFSPKLSLLCDAEGELVDTPSADGTFWRVKDIEQDIYLSGFYTSEPDMTKYPRDKFEVFKYTEGQAFYTLYLANKYEEGSIDKYTVKRNYFYDVKVNAVSGPGSNTPEGNSNDKGELIDPTPKPEEPLGGEAQMTAEIEVLPWTYIEQSGSL